MYDSKTHIHFVGIGGVGMAGIAEILVQLGYQVSGSDLKENELSQHLRGMGVQVDLGHQSKNIVDSTSVVVYSSAIPADNPELVEARSKRIPIIPRAEMLAELMRSKYGIAVAGSHGKTTTTSLVAHILKSAGLAPSVAIGGRVQSAASGADLGSGKFLVAEADESDGSFKLLKPSIAIVTNIDSEHLSHYGSFAKLCSSFEDFLEALPFYGLAVVCGDDKDARQLGQKIRDNEKRRLRFYGIEDGGKSEAHELWAEDLKIQGLTSSYTLRIDWGKIRSNQDSMESYAVELALPGRHMVLNSLAAIAVGIELGIKIETIIKSLANYPGVARRTEELGEAKGVLFVDDYAHHPTEIRATIRAVKKGFSKRLKGGRLVVAFQPHRYSRTAELFEEFCSCFSEADCVFLTEIYAAGEKPLEGISGENLAEKLENSEVEFFKDLASLEKSLVSELESPDVLLTLGAGSIGAFSRELYKKFANYSRA